MDIKEDEGGKCMRRSDGMLCLSNKETGKVWKGHLEGIMNEESDWDHYVERDTVEVPVECVNREEVMQAIGEMKTPGCPDVSLELIIVIREVVLQLRLP